MAVDSLPVEHLFTLEITAAMGDAYQVYNGPAGRRLIASISGGSFTGPKLAGTVAPLTGADWVTLRADKSQIGRAHV